MPGPISYFTDKARFEDEIARRLPPWVQAPNQSPEATAAMNAGQQAGASQTTAPRQGQPRTMTPEGEVPTTTALSQGLQQQGFGGTAPQTASSPSSAATVERGVLQTPLDMRGM